MIRGLKILRLESMQEEKEYMSWYNNKNGNLLGFEEKQPLIYFYFSLIKKIMYFFFLPLFFFFFLVEKMLEKKYNLKIGISVGHWNEGNI